jgi:hypothetical protein
MHDAEKRQREKGVSCHTLSTKTKIQAMGLDCSRTFFLSFFGLSSRFSSDNFMPSTSVSKSSTSFALQEQLITSGAANEDENCILALHGGTE